MRLFRFIIITLCVLGLALGGSAFWLNHRDAMAALPQPERYLPIERSLLMPQDKRRVEHITLKSTTLGDIGIVISLPDPLPDEKLPILIVLGGLGTGENNIRHVKGAGKNVVIGYDWPMPVRFYSGIAFITQMPDLTHRLMTIPAQVSSAIDWASEQPWADTKRISILGFSLGALAAPSVQHMMEQNNQKVGWTIIAYGGAPFGELFAKNPSMKPPLMRSILAPAIDILLQPLQPTQHLPYINGTFLVLEGQDDILIPATARNRLRDAVPEPKTVIVFEGNHMGVGPEKNALLQKIIAASKKWLVKNGAVNSL